MGSGMGIIFQQRRVLALHASAVKVGDRALLFVGKSGSGKSTTAMNFVENGHSLISDDLSVIKFKSDEALVHSGYPGQKISKDILEIHGETINPDEAPIDEDRLKYYREPRHFYAKPCPIYKIFFLTRGDVTESKILKEGSMGAFNNMYANTFRFGLVQPLGFSKSHMELCMKLYRSVEISTVIYPENEISLAANFEVFKTEIGLVN